MRFALVVAVVLLTVACGGEEPRVDAGALRACERFRQMLDDFDRDSATLDQMGVDLMDVADEAAAARSDEVRSAAARMLAALFAGDGDRLSLTMGDMIGSCEQVGYWP